MSRITSLDLNAKMVNMEGKSIPLGQRAKPILLKLLGDILG